MRRELIVGLLAPVLALVVGTGIAAAAAPESPPSPPRGAASPDATAGLARQVTLSPAEMRVQADAFVARMDGARGIVRRMLETARAQRDVVKTLCLTDKLNQLDVAIRSSRERKQSLDAAVVRSDADLSAHEFTILSVLRQRTDQLTAEANQCIGTTESYIGEKAEVTVQIESNMPQEDPSQYPVTSVIVQPPTCASCIK